MSYLIPILGVIFILACMAKRLDDKHREEEEIQRESEDSKSEQQMNSDSSTNESEIIDEQSNNKKDNAMKEENSYKREENNLINQEQPTTELLINILRTIGCQPEFDSEGNLHVKYQGESFSFSIGPRIIRIWDPFWFKIKSTDPSLTIVRETVNWCNFQSGATIVMTSANEEDDIFLHSHYDIFMHPSCPENEEYVEAALSSFFRTQRNFYQHFNLVDTNNN